MFSETLTRAEGALSMIYLVSHVYSNVVESYGFKCVAITDHLTSKDSSTTLLEWKVLGCRSYNYNLQQNAYFAMFFPSIFEVFRLFLTIYA